MVRRAVAAVVLLLALLVWSAPTAAAHAYVISQSPSSGAELATSPAAVVVRFSEPVTLASGTATSVVASSGERVDTGSPVLDGDRLTIPLQRGLPKGVYVANWSVISADSHPVGGSLQFGVGVPTVAVAEPAAPQPSSLLQLINGVLKGLVYLGLSVALGAAIAARLLHVSWPRLWLAAGFLAAAIGSLLQIPVQYLWGASASQATWNGLLQSFGSDYAVTIYLRVALLALAWTVRRWLPVFAVVAVLVVATVVHNGHGGAEGGWIFASTLAHATAATAWIGGLAVLGWAMLTRRLSVPQMRRLPAWSRYAGGAVAVIALTGVAQAVVQVRYPAALVHTTYGCVLIAKVVLVAVAGLFAIRGNRWVREHSRLEDRPAPGETGRLRRFVRREAAIGAAIVIVSGVLSSVDPAQATYAPTTTQTLTAGPYTVSLRIAPARRGPVGFRVTVTGAADATPLAQQVQLTLDEPGGAVRALPVEFTARIPGSIRGGQPVPMTFVSSVVVLPDIGDWRAQLTVVASPTEQYSVATDFTPY